ADRLSIVPFDILPVRKFRVAVGTRAAARRAIVEWTGEDGQAGAGAPVVSELPVGIDVVAKVGPVAAIIPAAPLIQIPPEIPNVPRRGVAAELDPVAHRAGVRAAHESEIVEIEAWTLHRNVGVE